MKNYTKIVKAAKLAARDYLRSKWVMNLLAEKRPLNKQIENNKKDNEYMDKLIKREDFKVKQATEQENPDLEDIKAEAKNVKEYAEKTIESNNKNIKNLEEELNKIDKKIEEVTNGTLKVSFDNMTEKAKEYLNDKYGADFVNGVYDSEVE